MRGNQAKHGASYTADNWPVGLIFAINTTLVYFIGNTQSIKQATF